MSANLRRQSHTAESVFAFPGIPVEKMRIKLLEWRAERGKMTAVARKRERNGNCVYLAKGICNKENWDTGLI